MWNFINDVLTTIDDFVWGVPLMVLILAGGLLLTARLGFLQIRKLPLALKWMVKNEDEGHGEISSFSALCTALSATIGTGNIVGVATAVGTGGPGALFWMVVTAFFGMATKYAEGLLAVKYRVVAPDGHSLGGPFYYIEQGMGKKWTWLAKLFAFFGVCVGLFGIGTFSQVNGISSAVHNFFDPTDAHTVKLLPFLGDYSWAVVIASLVLAFCVAAVLIGGVKRIASVSQIIVPFMAVIYIVFVLSLVICNITAVPAAFKTIVVAAFTPKAITGGAAKTKEPVRQGLVSMTGTFIDTIVICTLTGLSIVLTGAWQVDGLEGVAVTTYAFQQGLPFPAEVSSFILMLCLVFFAFTTILGWDYYSERCLEYLTKGNQKAIKIFRWLYIFAVFIGPYMTVSAVWTIADIFNGLMALPNMIALFALNGVVVAETKKFFERHKNGEIQ